MAKQVTEFEVGDVVVLKSGGPKMTVVRINSDRSVSTNWFSNTDGREISGDTFYTNTLILDQQN